MKQNGDVYRGQTWEFSNNGGGYFNFRGNANEIYKYSVELDDALNITMFFLPVGVLISPFIYFLLSSDKVFIILFCIFILHSTAILVSERKKIEIIPLFHLILLDIIVFKVSGHTIS